MGDYFGKRNKTIQTLYEKGMTYADIGKMFDISRQRVYEIVRYGNRHTPQFSMTAVRRRDGRQCRMCRTMTGRMEVHHVGDPKDHDPKNLITLCSKCHRQVEKLTSSTTTIVSEALDSRQ